MGLINDFTGMHDIEVGKIELLKNFSFFEVDSQFADTVFNSFSKKEYKGREINLEVAGSQGKEKKRGKEDSYEPREKRKDFRGSRKNDGDGKPDRDKKKKKIPFR